MDDKLLTLDDRWDRLIAAATRLPHGNMVLSLVEAVERKLVDDIAEQEARFASYMPARPADEPHDAQCQVTRYGAGYGNACTCKSNHDRRRQQVENAAMAGDLAFRSTLGSMESHAFNLIYRGKMAGISVVRGDKTKYAMVFNHGLYEVILKADEAKIVAGTELGIGSDGCLHPYVPGSGRFLIAKMLDDHDGGPNVFIDTERGLAASNRDLLIK